MTSKPSEPQEEPVVEQPPEVNDGALTDESLDKTIGGGAYPIPRGYGNPGLPG